MLNWVTKLWVILDGNTLSFHLCVAQAVCVCVLSGLLWLFSAMDCVCLSLPSMSQKLITSHSHSLHCGERVRKSSFHICHPELSVLRLFFPFPCLCLPNLPNCSFSKDIFSNTWVWLSGIIALHVSLLQGSKMQLFPPQEQHFIFREKLSLQTNNHHYCTKHYTSRTS